MSNVGFSQESGSKSNHKQGQKPPELLTSWDSDQLSFKHHLVLLCTDLARTDKAEGEGAGSAEAGESQKRSAEHTAAPGPGGAGSPVLAQHQQQRGPAAKSQLLPQCTTTPACSICPAPRPQLRDGAGQGLGL